MFFRLIWGYGNYRPLQMGVVDKSDLQFLTHSKKMRCSFTEMKHVYLNLSYQVEFNLSLDGLNTVNKPEILLLIHASRMDT
ncbi:MAG: hypothetical protein DRI65_08660 [Chloroflexota bacterium]|nr:MAG: hypothetical protein DRI65_08660 [Chloroflexota bacterium]